MNIQRVILAAVLLVGGSLCSEAAEPTQFVASLTGSTVVYDSFHQYAISNKFTTGGFLFQVQNFRGGGSANYYKDTVLIYDRVTRKVQVANKHTGALILDVVTLGNGQVVQLDPRGFRAEQVAMTFLGAGATGSIYATSTFKLNKDLQITGLKWVASFQARGAVVVDEDERTGVILGTITTGKVFVPDGK